MEIIICLSSSPVLDVGILSATGHLTAVTYLAQVLEIKIKFLSSQARRN